MIYYLLSLLVFIIVFYIIGGKYKLFFIILTVFCLAYHWFQIRPENIRKECSIQGLSYIINSEDELSSTEKYGLTKSQLDGVEAYRKCLKNNGLYK